MEKRSVILAAYIGHNGVGKTSTALSLAKHWRSANKKSKIIAFDPHEIFSREKGLINNVIPASDEFWAERLVQKKNGRYIFEDSLLILDDYRALLKGNQTPGDVMDLLMLRRRLGMDIIYITHNPKLVLERFAYFTTHYFIFYTESDFNDWSDRIPNYYECQKASHAVNKYVRKYGRGKYPDFPHIVVSTESNKSDTYNIDSDKIETLYDQI